MAITCDRDGESAAASAPPSGVTIKSPNGANTWDPGEELATRGGKMVIPSALSLVSRVVKNSAARGALAAAICVPCCLCFGLCFRAGVLRDMTRLRKREQEKENMYIFPHHAAAAAARQESCFAISRAAAMLIVAKASVPRAKDGEHRRKSRRGKF